jgi:trk system potassium uptake protein TrkA
MNIVILGAGSIGSYLALVLSKEDHNVIVIDCDSKALEKLAQTADIATRLGSGTDWHLLAEIKENSPDFFIAMSSNDETNLIACAIAKKLGYPKTVARIRQNIFLDSTQINFHQLFSVDHILGTELIIAHEIFKCIVNPGNLAIENFAQGAVQMQTIIIPENFPQKGKSLAEIRPMDNLLVGLIRRKTDGEKRSLIFPKGQHILHPGDEATVIGKTNVMQNLHNIFGIIDKTVRSAVIVGSSGVALHLIKLLIEKKILVKIIEQNELKCSKLARLFPSAVILNHDGTDLDFLREERVSHSDVFIACTESHETNILTAILGKQIGCHEVITLVSDDSVIPLLKKFDITYALSERASITRKLHLILHDNTFISLASLYESQAMVIEVKISEDCKIIGRSISELSNSLPKNFLIAMVKNHKGIHIPDGNTILAPGETAIVICSSESAHRLRDLF